MVKKKLNKREAAQKRKDTLFKNKIVSIFKAAEFQYLNTGCIELTVGIKKGDIDLVFLYDNLLIICEYTTTRDNNIKGHLNKTKIFYDEIKQDFHAKGVVLSKLKEKFSDKFDKFSQYDLNQYQVKYLYIHSNKISSPADFMKYIKLVNDDILQYFHKNKILKHSSKNEIFRFLDVDINALGDAQSGVDSTTIKTSVIAPESVSGLRGIQVVSFLMKAEDLMQCGYVLRKDNWEESAGLYQRLLIPTKINSIRKYLVNEERGFINNVIVSLPKETKFLDDKGDTIALDRISKISNLSVQLPKKINSIGIIDGQHRVYAHYESDTKDETKIAKLREKLHILVTGMVFNKDTSDAERIKMESKLFLEINGNAKIVSADVLLAIEAIQNPNSSRSIARSILVELNKKDLFFNKFEMTTLSKTDIKSTSVIKSALSQLVEVNKEKETLFKYLSFNEKNILCEQDDGSKEYEVARNEYIQECAKFLNQYFSAVKRNFKEEWNNPKTHKIFSAISINGFLSALKATLATHGVQDSDFYDDRLKKLDTDFSKGGFPYAGSQWKDFAKNIQEKCFYE